MTTIPNFVLRAATGLGIWVIVHAFLLADASMEFLVEIGVFAAIVDASMAIPDLSFRAAAGLCEWIVFHALFLAHAFM